MPHTGSFGFIYQAFHLPGAWENRGTHCCFLGAYALEQRTRGQCDKSSDIWVCLVCGLEGAAPEQASLVEGSLQGVLKDALWLCGKQWAVKLLQASRDWCPQAEVRTKWDVSCHGRWVMMLGETEELNAGGRCPQRLDVGRQD